MRFDQTRAALEDAREEAMTPERMVELVRHFYFMGLMRDQGGGVAVRVPASPATGGQPLVYCSPTQVQKEQWSPADLFVVRDDADGTVLQRPAAGSKTPSSPLALIRATGANCVIHTHSKHAVLLTKLLAPRTEFSIQDQEMLVGIHNRALPGLQTFQNTDLITVPIVEAKPNERLLGPPIRAALAAYPEASAVLVRGHGVFCFGFGLSWQRTKMMLECYEYLFEMGCMMISSGLPTAPGLLVHHHRQLQQHTVLLAANNNNNVAGDDDDDDGLKSTRMMMLMVKNGGGGGGALLEADEAEQQQQLKEKLYNEG